MQKTEIYMKYLRKISLMLSFASLLIGLAGGMFGGVCAAVFGWILAVHADGDTEIAAASLAAAAAAGRYLLAGVSALGVLFYL